MATVERTLVADESLDEIGEYVAVQSGSFRIAFDLLDRIEAKCQSYARQPLMETNRPDLGDDVRCFTVDSYVVTYRPRDDGILVLLVMHGARDIPQVFQQIFGKAP